MTNSLIYKQIINTYKLNSSLFYVEFGIFNICNNTCFMFTFYERYCVTNV